ncbi:MAG: hypothetical protein WCW77_00730 [Patescibacteria group bacterium]|jgi:hypothetical protein
MKKIFLNKYFYLALAVISLALNYQIAKADNPGWTVYGNNIYNPGNVGIGTTSPVTLLHMFASSAAPQLLIERSAALDSALSFKNTEDQWIVGIDQSNSNALTISDSMTIGTGQKVTITTDGYVGIGTTAPTSGTLQVAGASTVNPLWIYGTGPLAQGVRNTIFATGANSTGSVNIGIQNSGTAAVNTGSGVNFYANRTTSGQTLIGRTVSKIQNIADAIYASDFSIQTAVGGSLVTSLYINSSGNVGIGTTSPSKKLEVNGDIKLNGDIVSDGDICIGKCD